MLAARGTMSAIHILIIVKAEPPALNLKITDWLSEETIFIFNIWLYTQGRLYIPLRKIFRKKG